MSEQKCVLEYHADGIPVSDFDAESSVMKFVKGGVVLKVSTDNVFLAARAMIASGIISNADISFSFQGEHLPIDVNGRMVRWPNGFCDRSDTWLMTLLKGRRT